MPYTRAELLAAVRKDHPELAHIDDIKLFKAIAIDHPQLAQNVVEPTFQSPKYGPTGPGGLDIASEQAGHVMEGIGESVTGIPSGLMALADTIKKQETGEDPYAMVKIIMGMGQPLAPIAKTLVGDAPNPESPEWVNAAKGSGTMLGGAILPDALGGISDAIPAPIKNLGRAAGTMVADVAGGAKGAIVEGAKALKVGAQTGEFPTRPPAASITEALNPGDLQFQKHAPIALRELRASSKGVGGVEDALAGLEERRKVNNAGVDSIVGPQKGVDASSYRNHIIQKQIDSIPLDTKPLVRKRLMADIYRRTPEKITIGWLNDMRSELSATQSPFYGKDVTGQVTMDAGQRAVDIARGEAVRESFYHSLDNAPGAMGGGEAARAYNERIGATMHMKDALQHKQNAAVAEHQSPLGDKLSKVRFALGRPGHTIAHGLPQSIDEMVAEAVRNTKEVPSEIAHKSKGEFYKPGLSNTKGPTMRPGGPALGTPAPGPTQLELAPSGGGDLLNPQERTPITPGQGPMEDVVRRQRAGVSPVPSEPVPGQLELAPTNGGDLLNPQARSPITPGHSAMEDVYRRERAGSMPAPEELPQGQIDLPVTPPPEKAFPMFEEGGVNELTKAEAKANRKSPSSRMSLPKNDGPKLDSNFQIIDDTKPQATPGDPTPDILEIVKRLLASQKP